MKIVKFRAWDKRRKRMVEVTSINFREGTIQEDTRYAVNRKIYLDDVVLMQSIGRTGMNKNDDEVDIFEGDIIQVIEQGCQMGFYVEDEYVGVVEYDKGHCTYYLNLITTNYYNELPDEIDGIPIFKGDEEPERYYFNDDLFLVSEDIQILGNIYENQELLEEI